MGIEAEEHWLETNVPYCYSIKLTLKGLNFSTSGKGLSLEFALASAHGEMIERVQLGFLGKRATQKDGAYSMNDSQDIQLPLQQLLDGNISVTDVDPKEYTTSLFPEGVYHMYDYQFFFRNMQSNVAVRLEAFLTADNA